MATPGVPPSKTTVAVLASLAERSVSLISPVSGISQSPVTPANLPGGIGVLAVLSPTSVAAANCVLASEVVSVIRLIAHSLAAFVSVATAAASLPLF